MGGDYIRQFKQKQLLADYLLRPYGVNAQPDLGFKVGFGTEFPSRMTSLDHLQSLHDSFDQHRVHLQAEVNDAL